LKSTPALHLRQPKHSSSSGNCYRILLVPRAQLLATDMVLLTRATALKRCKGRLSLAVDGDAISRTCVLAPVIAT
jgi:hypothetical protein